MARKLRNIKLYITDILNSINKINEYTLNFSLDDLKNDSKTTDAVIRNFEIIGEAASKLPHKFKNENNYIDWRALIDFRNVIIHEYFGVNLEIIWDIIQNELILLFNKIDQLNRTLPNGLIEWEE